MKQYLITQNGSIQGLPNVPVSYTHLDVYKRQHQPWSCRAYWC